MITLVIANIVGWLSLHWRYVAICAALLVVIIVGAVTVKNCGKRTPKLDEKAIAEAQKAIAEQDRKVMIEILTNSDVAEKKTDDDLANAITTAKGKAEQMTNAELAAELERRAQ